MRMSDLIGRQAAIDAVTKYAKFLWETYHETCNIAGMIDAIDCVPIASPWHRVEDELPPNAKHPGAFCPKVRVLTRWGVTDGWFNPDMGRNGLWCVLLWFFMGTWKEDDIDFERGDRPKMVWLSQDDVIAWMPIEPPKEE